MIFFGISLTDFFHANEFRAEKNLETFNLRWAFSRIKYDKTLILLQQLFRFCKTTIALPLHQRIRSQSNQRNLCDGNGYATVMQRSRYKYKRITLAIV